MKLKVGDQIRLKHGWFTSENINSINDKSKLLELSGFTAVSIWLPTLGIRGEATENSEIEIITSNELSNSSIETELINYLDFFESQYLKGLFDVLERENNKTDCYNRAKHQMINDKKWLNK